MAKTPKIQEIKAGQVILDFISSFMVAKAT